MNPAHHMVGFFLGVPRCPKVSQRCPIQSIDENPVIIGVFVGCPNGHLKTTKKPNHIRLHIQGREIRMDHWPFFPLVRFVAVFASPNPFHLHHPKRDKLDKLSMFGPCDYVVPFRWHHDARTMPPS